MAKSWTIVALVRRLRALSRMQTATFTLAAFLVSALLGVSGAFFLLLLLTLPVVAFFGHIFRLQPQYDITDQEVGQLVVTFLGGIFPGALLASLIEMLLAPLFAIVCFYDQSDAIVPQLRAFLDAESKETNNGGASPPPPHSGRIANLLLTLQIEKTLGYYVFMLLCAYVVAGVVEEATKLWLVQAKCLCNCSSASRPSRGWLCDPRRLLNKRVHHANHHVVIVLAVTCGALGFSFIENVGYTFVMPTFSDRLSAAVLRSIVSMPLHTICGAVSGMRLARSRLQLRGSSSSTSTETSGRCSGLRANAWVLAPAVFVHGTFDFQIFVVSSLVSDASADAHPIVYGTVLPALLSLGVLVGGYKFGQREWRELEAARAQSQYATLDRDAKDFGVESDDDDEDEDQDDTTGPKRATRGVLLV